MERSTLLASTLVSVVKRSSGTNSCPRFWIKFGTTIALDVTRAKYRWKKNAFREITNSTVETIFTSMFLFWFFDFKYRYLICAFFLNFDFWFFTFFHNKVWKEGEGVAENLKYFFMIICDVYVLSRIWLLICTNKKCF